MNIKNFVPIMTEDEKAKIDAENLRLFQIGYDDVASGRRDI
jgi:hypothetical protein